MRDKKARKSSLTAKITVICLSVTFLTALLLSGAFITNARGIIQQQATTATVDNIHSLRDLLLASFARWEALVKFTAIAASPLITQTPFDPAALQDLLRRNSDLQPEVKLLYASSYIRWTEPAGFFVREDGLVPIALWDNRDRPWFIAAMANPGHGNTGFTDPHFDGITGNLQISIATNVFNFATGLGVGIVGADVDLVFLHDMLAGQAIIPGHSIFLIDREGRFITHPYLDAVLTDNFFDEFEILARYRHDILGRPAFMSYGRDVFVYSEFIPGLQWILVSVIPVSAIFAEMNQFMMRMILIGVALLVLAALVSIVFTYKGLTIPIRSIKSAAASLAGMDFSVDIKKAGNDEIGDIQGAMITIRDNLKKGIEDMKASHENAMYMVQEEQAAFKERTHAILDSSPLVCALSDEAGTVVNVNKEVENMLGISDQQIFISNFSKFLPKSQPDGSDSAAKRTEMLTKALREGSSRYEWSYLHSDGSLVPVEEIVHRVDVDNKPHTIAYSRDLREYYREREKERIVQGKLQAMMGQFNEHVEVQSVSVATSSSATEEMIANIRSVTDTLSTNAKNVKDLQDASQAGHTSLNGVVSDIQGIARESESLLEINAVMESIASQTNLLSMNAAIEAAHAGDSGRGFAVVADEIRKLAESSSEQSKTIGGALKGIKDSIDKITKSTDVVLSKFEAIEGGVKTVAVQEDTILHAMEEQGRGSLQILEAISNVNEVTHQVKEAARRMVETSKESMHKADDTETQAFTDELTGVRNRKYFNDAAEQELRYCIDENRDFNLIIFGIDNMSQIMSTHGNVVWNEALKVLTMRARNSFKQGTLLARYSDEEFVITLPNVRQGTAVKLAEQIQKKVKEAPFATKGAKLDISISLGVAARTNTCKTLRDIISNAEKALSRARTAGANKVVTYG